MLKFLSELGRTGPVRADLFVRLGFGMAAVETLQINIAGEPCPAAPPS